MPVRSVVGRSVKTKRTVRISMQDPPDIPHPVRIIHLRLKQVPAAPPAVP